MLGEDNILRRSWETALKQWKTLNENEDELQLKDNARRRRRRKHLQEKQRAPNIPTLSAKSSVVTPAELVEVMGNVPLRYAGCAWERLFSTNVDGVSLGTFYRRMEDIERPVVMLVRDAEGACFGCYGEPWRIEKSYYGNGENFVFTIRPKQKVWRWTGKNNYFQLGQHDSISVGGGGQFSLHFDSMFERGSSGICETFNSPSLASKPRFQVVVLEAWVLVPRLSKDRYSISR